MRSEKVGRFRELVEGTDEIVSTTAWNGDLWIATTLRIFCIREGMIIEPVLRKEVRDEEG